MKSMTGHGRGEAGAKGLRVIVECFSVNRKQVDVALAASRDLLWMEPHVREEVAKHIARGKVQVSLAVERTESAAAGLVDHERAASLLKDLRQLQKKLGLAGDISIETILAAPGVLRAESESTRELWPVAKKALVQALGGMIEMRTKEGAHLQKELGRALKTMTGLHKQIRALAPAVPPRQRENLLKRLQNANLPLDVLDTRVLAEIAVFAERCDISEELSRLESHFAQFAECLRSEGPAGRTMEFLAQEMGREWNTTGSKANDSEISRLVVAAKAELDRLREQLANIE